MSGNKDDLDRGKSQLPEALQRFLTRKRRRFKCDDADWQVRIEIPEGIIARSLPPESIIVANDGGGNLLYLKKVSPEKFGSEVFVRWQDEAGEHQYCADIAMLTDPPPPGPTQLPPIHYFEGEVKVQIGDEVTTRSIWSFFMKKNGRVFYVPGISKKNLNYEHHGLVWVGIRLSNGDRLAEIVDPKSFRLMKRVQFIRHEN